MEYKRREVKRGYWYYDEILKKGVAIIAINYDYWYEIDKADGFDVTDQHPVLNENGESFMIGWYDAEFKTIESYHDAGINLEDAIAKAEMILGQKIEWI